MMTKGTIDRLQPERTEDGSNREWKTNDDDDIYDDNTEKSSPGLAITLH